MIVKGHGEWMNTNISTEVGLLWIDRIICEVIPLSSRQPHQHAIFPSSSTSYTYQSTIHSAAVHRVSTSSPHREGRLGLISA